MLQRGTVTICATATTRVPKMLESPPDDLIHLLEDVPIGEYLVWQDGIWRVLWRLSEGEPLDGALELAEGWALLPAV